MKWFRNFNVGTKLMLGVCVVILCMGLMSFTGYRSIRNIQQSLDEIFNIRLPSIDYVIEADRDLHQLLVAERSMIFTGVNTETFDTLVVTYEENLRQADERWEKYKELASTEEEQALFPKYENAREVWKEFSRRVVDGRLADTREGRREAIDLTIGLAQEKFEEMREYLDQLTEINLQIAANEHQAADATYHAALIGFFTITAAGLILGIGIMGFIGRGISKPLKQAVDVSNGIAEGDLSQLIEVNRKDETGQLLSAMKNMVVNLRSAALVAEQIAQGDLSANVQILSDKDTLGKSLSLMVANLKKTVQVAEQIARGDLNAEVQILSDNDTLGKSLSSMLTKLHTIVTDVKASAENVASGSLGLSSNAEGMSEGTSEQAAAAEEASSSMEEMAANIQQNANNALQTEKIAVKAAQDARESGKAVAQTVEAMNKIVKKIAIIEEIGKQTHMLSLNATIEAAKAGEYGKGFAVVAAEVRALAQQSKTAAEEIKEVADSSVAVAGRAGEMLSKLVPDIQKTSDLVQEISAASHEQNSGANQINSAIQQLNQVIQQNAATSEETASTAEELASQAEMLQSAMAFFKVESLIQEEAEAAENIQEIVQQISPSDIDGLSVETIVREVIKSLQQKKHQATESRTGKGALASERRALEFVPGEGEKDSLDDEFERF